jgi:hypothetical protein
LISETKRDSSLAQPLADAVPAVMVRRHATIVATSAPETKPFPMFGPLVHQPNNKPASPRHERLGSTGFDRSVVSIRQPG